jgi:hypothetical protein
MSGTRTEAELAELRAEAERRVRNGERQVDVARDLGLPPTTVSGWAARGGWLRRDLKRENNEERAKIAAGAIESIRDRKVWQPPDRVWLGKYDEVDAATPAFRFIVLTQAMMEQGRLEDAERSARSADRLLSALEKLEKRAERRELHEVAKHGIVLSREAEARRDAAVKEAFERLNALNDYLVAHCSFAGPAAPRSST